MQSVSPDKTTPKPDLRVAESSANLEKLLLENRQYLRAIYESTERSRKYILWGRIMALIYLVMIIIPVIIAFIYLPSYFGQALKPYKELLQTEGSTTDMNSLDEYLKVFKNINP